MATRVGQAYVSVTADGSQINKDILDGVDDVNWDKVASTHSKKFGSALKREFEAMEARLGAQLGKGLSNAISRDDAAGAAVRKMVKGAFDSGQLDALISKVTRDAGGDAGQRFGAAFDDEVKKAVSDSLTNSLKSSAARGDVFTDIFSTSGDGGLKSARLGPVTTAAVQQAKKALKDLEDAEEASALRSLRAELNSLSEKERAEEASALRSLQAELNFLNAKEGAERKSLDERIRASQEAARREIVSDDRVFQNRLRARRADVAAAFEADDLIRRNRIQSEAASGAADRISGVRLPLSVRVDERVIENARREVEEKLARRGALSARLDMELDLPDYEIAEINRRIAGIDREIELRVDNRTLLRDLAAVNGATGTLGARIGRLFGAGSRNNAFNVLGRTIGTTVNITERLGTVSRNAFNAFQRGASAAGQGASMLTRAMSGARGVMSAFGPAISSAAAALPALGAAGAAVVAVLSVLVSGIGAAIAGMAAMAGTAIAAAAGGLTVLAGALGAAAIAGGLLTAAFMSMTEAQRGLLQNAFIPLKEQMVGIGQTIMEDLVAPIYAGNSAFQVWSANLQQALQLLQPVADVMGTAFAEAGNTLTALLSGPGFQKLSVALTTYLPQIIQNLSAAFGYFLDGLSASFAAVMPYVLQFSDYLNRAAQTFSNFANSASGQNGISDFVSKAVVSLSSLWGAVKSVTGYISDVLFSDAALSAGTTIFDSISDTFNEFRDNLSQGDVEQWFADAITFGEALWSMFSGFGNVLASLYNSGVVQAIAMTFDSLGHIFDVLAMVLTPVIKLLGAVLPVVMFSITGPVDTVIMAFKSLVATLQQVLVWANKIPGVSALVPDVPEVDWSGITDGWKGIAEDGYKAFNLDALFGDVFGSQNDINKAAKKNSKKWDLPKIEWNTGSIKDTQARGNAALNQTFESNGGYLPDPKKIAAKSGKAAKAAAKALRRSFRDLFQDARKEILDLSKNAESAEDVTSSISDLLDKMAKEAEKQTPKVAKRIEKMMKRLSKQTAWDTGDVNKLVRGEKVKNATLAEVAQARGILAEKMEEATKKLEEAVKLRDDYAASVADSVRSYGAITTAQASVIDGVQQMLTSGDIISNMRTRLAAIQKFQANLSMLRAQGLSDSAYKQIVDSGVESGSAFAQALIDGGPGAVSTVNSLSSSMDKVATDLGFTAADALYQSGVNAAQGLVDGLNASSSKLEAVATNLGARIAKAIIKSMNKGLGIKSPSRAMIAAMGYVGDGIGIGLDAQSSKVAAASERLSNNIAPTPYLARASGGYARGVSGNSDSSGLTDATAVGNSFDITIVTPTEDPRAVAVETVNEITGRVLV